MTLLIRQLPFNVVCLISDFEDDEMTFLALIL